ncbi:MAG: hypothetical protein ACMUIG_00870 [Thermoplasmatota archaeon]
MMSTTVRGDNSDIGRGTDSLLSNYEVVLSPMIGFLSRFIIRKQFAAATNGGIKSVDRSTVERFMDNVLGEVSPLIGPSKTDDLKKDLMQINDIYYQSEGVHEK